MASIAPPWTRSRLGAATLKCNVKRVFGIVSGFLAPVHGFFPFFFLYSYLAPSTTPLLLAMLIVSALCIGEKAGTVHWFKFVTIGSSSSRPKFKKK